jgi:hypothetical protein
MPPNFLSLKILISTTYFLLINNLVAYLMRCQEMTQ